MLHQAVVTCRLHTQVFDMHWRELQRNFELHNSRIAKLGSEGSLIQIIYFDA